MTEMFVEAGHAVAKVTRMTGLASSTWYARKSERRVANPQRRGRPMPGYSVNPDGTIVLDHAIISALKDYRDQIEFVNAGGCDKLHHYLRRDYGYHVNHKKLYRLCKEHGLLLPRNRKKISKARRLCENRVINAQNKLWQFDIKYGYVHGENRYFFLLAYIDVFLRKVVGYHVGLSCKAGDLVFTLDQAIKKAGVKDIDGLAIRSDNGPQMTSNMMREYLDGLELDLSHEFTPPSTPDKNAFVESFFSIVEVEFFQTRYFRNYQDAYTQTVDFIRHYHERRLHGSLSMLPPLEAEVAFTNGQLQIAEVRI